MAKFVIEVKKENIWCPVYPSLQSSMQFSTMEAAERFKRWVFPQNPPNVRVAPR